MLTSRVASTSGERSHRPYPTIWITKPQRPTPFQILHLRATPSSRRTNAAVIARSFGRCDAENEGGGGDRSSAGSVGRCPCHGTSRKWDGERRYGTDDGPPQKAVVFLHLLSCGARTALLTYVCTETKSEMNSDPDSFDIIILFAKERSCLKCPLK